MGKLNKFALAPGSLSDITGAVEVSSSSEASQAKRKVKKVVKKAAPKTEEEAPAEDATAVELSEQ